MFSFLPITFQNTNKSITHNSHRVILRTPTLHHTNTLSTTLQEKQMVLQGLSGVPMVASSPQRHDGGPLNVAVGGPIDVQAYQPPWKSLVEFAQTQDPDRIDPSSHSQYQQLMSHVSTGRDWVHWRDRNIFIWNKQCMKLPIIMNRKLIIIIILS